MKAERRSNAIKQPLKFSCKMCPIQFSLHFNFRLCKIGFSLSSVSDRLFRFQIGFRSLSDSFQTGSMKNRKNFRFQIGSDWFRLTLQISDWTFRLQIGFRLASNSFQIVVWNNRKNFRFQIGSDWLQNELLWLFVELFALRQCPENTDQFFYNFVFNILSIF